MNVCIKGKLNILKLWIQNNNNNNNNNNDDDNDNDNDNNNIIIRIMMMIIIRIIILKYLDCNKLTRSTPFQGNIYLIYFTPHCDYCTNLYKVVTCITKVLQFQIFASNKKL